MYVDPYFHLLVFMHMDRRAMNTRVRPVTRTRRDYNVTQVMGKGCIIKTKFLFQNIAWAEV